MMAGASQSPILSTLGGEPDPSDPIFSVSSRCSSRTPNGRRPVEALWIDEQVFVRETHAVDAATLLAQTDLD
jgi:hypothetical protein